MLKRLRFLLGTYVIQSASAKFPRCDTYCNFSDGVTRLPSSGYSTQAADRPSQVRVFKLRSKIGDV